MDGLQSFLSSADPSLKICGVTNPSDAEKLAQLKVSALGINFWPQSKRYCPAEDALTFLPGLAGKIVRVGVFVNNARQVAPELVFKGALDAIQLHGDEDDEELAEFLTSGVPVIRSLALKPDDNLAAVIGHYQALSQKSGGTLALLLDAHAPGVYGGTGETIDWNQAAEFIQLSPLPVLLAGGIIPENAAEAATIAKPAALDIASGAESAPGIKDFVKVAALQAATQPPTQP
ncbi:MAG: phosphoribosylanthranilate isomerase [Roseibacillus sp.]